MKWPFGRKAHAPQEPDSCVPADVLLYAIGDIHGRSDLLDALLTQLAEDAAKTDSRPTLVFLGDYVDRGPDSRGVVSRLRELAEDTSVDVHCLRGNHEQTLLDFLSDPAIGPKWVEYGGAPTLQSYSVAVPRLRGDEAGWEEARDLFEKALPSADLIWLAKLPSAVEFGDYLFVHAGIRPGVALAEQVDEDLLWIREPFLSSSARHERVIVHGHTPTEHAEMGRWRIGLDTGAYATGRLTALRLQGSERRLIQTSR